MSRFSLSLALLASLAASPALAHAILVGSSPAEGAHVPAGALSVTLRYNSRIDAKRSKVTLSAPDGTLARLDSTAGNGPQLLQAAAQVQPGAYTLHWQVLAVDGHITRGNLRFTVDAK
jgi:methionine-rich copper-binding protein CopC